MNELRQLEKAFLKAYENGDTESAKILAQELQRLTEAPAVEEVKPQPQTGFAANVKAGLEALRGDISALQAGVTGSREAAAEAEQHRRRAAELGAIPEFTEHPLDYVTGMLGRSTAYMGAPVLAGLALSPWGRAASIGAGLLTSGTQFAGSNLTRQLEQGVLPEDLNVSSAVAAAAPQAALDYVGFRFIPGIRRIFGEAGVQIGNKEAAGIVNRFILPAAKTAGVEGVTEAGQAVLERLQAGLELTSPEARKEYFENFLGGAILGGVLSVPGTALEGFGSGQKVAGAGLETQAPTVEGAAPPQVPQPLLALPAPTIQEPTLRTVEKATAEAVTPAPTEKATPAQEEKVPTIYKMMEDYDTLKNSLDPLAKQIEEARVSGDNQAARELQKQYRENAASMDKLQAKIDELGGTTQTREEAKNAYESELKKINAEIAKQQKAVLENSREDVRDYEAVDKAEARIQKLEERRAKLEEDNQRYMQLLRVKETPANEQIPLFDAESQQPVSEDVLKLDARTEKGETVAELEKKYVQATQGPQPKAPDYSKAIEEKEAEADKLLSQITETMKRGPQAVAAENKAAALAALTEARENLRKTQEAAAAKPSAERDEAVSDAQYRLAQLTRNFEGLSPAALRERHISEINRQSEQLNQLYADIDALRGGVQRAVPPPTLFSKRNQLYTAAATGDIDAVRRLLDYDKAQEKQAKLEAEPTPAEKVAEALEPKVKSRKVSQRIVFDDHYDAVMEEVETLRNKIIKPQGNAKKSILQRAEELYPEIEALQKYIADKNVSAVERGNKRRTLQAKIKEYEPLQNAMVNARDKIDALLRSLHTVETVGTKAEIAAAEKQALDIAGKSKREKSREQKAFEKQQKGTVKADPDRIARELGEPTDAYRAYAAPLLKAIKAKADSFNKFLATGKERLAALKEKVGDTSERYKTSEAGFVQEAQKRRREFEIEDKKVKALLETKAIELGRANPWFRSELVKATKAVSESAATAGEPVKRSRRTTQETRKVAKLGTMSTGTPESQARSAARQAGFEAKLTEEKGEAADYARAQARKQTKKKAEGAEAATAVGQAMQKAAKAKIDKETPKQQRGSEIESKDLAAAQVEALEKDDVRAALNSIMEDETNSDVNRAVAAALEVYLDKTNVTVHDRLYADDGYELLGQATSKQIDISRRGLTQETLLHEGVHAAVERVIQMAKENFAQLSKEQQAAYRELERLYNAIKNDPSITSKNAKSSISEFAAEALSNERLQDQLRAKKWTLGDAFKSFTSFILKMLGVKNVDNMLDASLSAVEALMVPSSTRMDAVEDVVREQAKSVGVVEKGKGMFGFKSFTQPATQYNIVATEPAVIDKLKANFTGLAGRVQWVDKYAAISEAFAKGVDAKVLSDLEATNGEYLLRFGENVSQYAQQALTNGRMQLVKKKVEGGNEYLYKSEKGANLMRVYGELEKAGIANSTDLDNMFTIYMAGKRADKVGWDKLWVGDSTKAKQDYAAVMAQVNGSQKIKDAFEAALKEYREFNNGLLDFAEQCGALKPEEVAEFKRMDYVPYYRVNTNGDIELFSDQEKRLTIGSIKEEPHLQELVGDNSKILPLSVSAIQNAFLLTNMALRNNTVRDTSFLLRKMGIASAMNEGAGPAGYNTVRFKIKGVPHYAIIDSDKFGIPADLIVKGMEGIKTTMPFIVKLMGKPADWVRKFVTRSPTYAVRQIIRDPMTAWMTTGVDGVPVLNALREMSSMVAGRSEVERALMEAGAITSNVYTGGKEDLDKFIRDVGVGKTGWGKWMARFDAFALQGDAATRAVVYKDSIAKGMSEQQALLRTLESMNFGRRGLSPTVQMLNTLIPFFNSQIQGLDVIYRAFRGKMPYSQRLEIQQKLALRGAMLAVGTIAYAYMMQDDEAYKRAKPEERLANWFVRLPGVKDPVKIPVPFELGYIFKSLPEAVINASADDNRNKDITEGMGKLVWQSVPLTLPAAIKPAVEIYMNKSFFGGDIESQREVNTLEPTQRYRNTTTELAKMLGGITGVAGLSPIKVDYLIRGYTGGLGIMLASLLDPLMESDKAEPTKDPHQWPLVGGLFQASEGRGVRDAAYDRMLEIQQAKGTYKHLMQEGRREEAQQFLEENRHLISKASMSGRVQQQLGEWASLRRRILDSATMTQEQKDERLDRLDQLSTRYAERFLQATE